MLGEFTVLVYTIGIAEGDVFHVAEVVRRRTIRRILRILTNSATNHPPRRCPNRCYLCLRSKHAGSGEWLPQARPCFANFGSLQLRRHTDLNLCESATAFAMSQSHVPKDKLGHFGTFHVPCPLHGAASWRREIRTYDKSKPESGGGRCEK